jgi:VanZ family protein
VSPFQPRSPFLTRVLRWAPPIFYMGFIFFASSVPGDALPAWHFWDKAEHLLAYSVLGILFLFPLAEARLALVTPRTGAIAVVLATLYGAFDEIHQIFTPGRSPDVRDLLADFLGATVGVVVVLLVRLVVTRLAVRRVT